MQERIREAVAGYRFRYSTELRLHQELDAAFAAAGLDATPEAPLDGGRIDYLVGRTGVEVKVAGSVEAVTRQLARYADSAAVDDLVLVSTRSAHRGVPRVLNDKPVAVIVVGGHL